MRRGGRDAKRDAENRELSGITGVGRCGFRPPKPRAFPALLARPGSAWGETWVGCHSAQIESQIRLVEGDCKLKKVFEVEEGG